jgi:hypothetical protein
VKHDASPMDREIAETEQRLSVAIAERERTQEAMFAARNALHRASHRGNPPQSAVEEEASAKHAWEAACAEEGRVRVRLCSLGVARGDWRRQRELEATLKRS